MYTLEVILARAGESNGVYFEFPTSRRRLWETMRKNGIEKNKWRKVYSGEIEDIPDELCVETLRI